MFSKKLVRFSRWSWLDDTKEPQRCRHQRQCEGACCLGMKALKAVFARFQRELLLYRNILADPRTPRLTKFLLGSAVAYTVTPIDLIPDFIPIIGHVDDVIIIPTLVYVALKTIPKNLLEEHRQAIDARMAEAKEVERK